MKKYPSQRCKKGFTLIEVLLAIGVASLCLISIYGLLSIALSMNQNLILQSEATTILSSVIEDVGSTPTTLTTSVRYQVNLPAAGSATPTTATLYFDQDENQLPNSTSALFSVSLNIQPPPANQKLSTILSAIAYFPPYNPGESASQMIAQHSVQFTTSLNRN